MTTHRTPSMPFATMLSMLLASVLANTAVTAGPGEVQLKMRGGSFQISGELRSYDGQRYVIETRPHGTMSFEASRFECLGDACLRRGVSLALPSERLVPGQVDGFVVRGSREIASGLLPRLIESWAASVDATTTRVLLPAAGQTQMRVSDRAGAELATIDIHRQDTPAAFRSLETGEASLALADAPLSRAAAGDHPTLARRAKAVQSEAVLVRDTIAVVVSPSNPLATLPLTAVAGIFSGKITDWSEVGLAPGPIKVLAGPPQAAGLEVFTRVVLAPRGVTLGDAVTVHADERGLADAVARDPSAIGIVSAALAGNARPIGLEDTCGLVLRPTAFAAKAGEYPLLRTYYMHAGKITGHPVAASLLRHALSPAAQPVIAAAGWVDADLATLPFAGNAPRLAHAINAPAAAFDLQEMRRLLADIDGARRLSLTIRISDQLDATSRLEINRLAEYLLASEQKAKSVLLAGFTDATGRFAANVTRAQRRAGIVRTALLTAAAGRLDQRTIAAKGYGPLAPIACNGTPEGLLLNRRVEVWLKD